MQIKIEIDHEHYGANHTTSKKLTITVRFQSQTIFTIPRSLWAGQVRAMAKKQRAEWKLG